MMVGGRGVINTSHNKLQIWGRKKYLQLLNIELLQDAFILDNLCLKILSYKNYLHEQKSLSIEKVL